MDIQQLDDVIRSLNDIRTQDTSTWLDNPWHIFIRKCYLLNPQQWGGLIRSYLFHRLGWTKVKDTEDRGDVRNTLGQYFEVKVSMITPKNAAINVVQIRLWQNISGYHIFVIDTTNHFKLYHFSLSKSEMKQEDNLLGHSAHGTQQAIIHNVNKERRFSVPWDLTNEHLTRWKQNYLQVDTFTNGIPRID